MIYLNPEGRVFLSVTATTPFRASQVTFPFGGAFFRAGLKATAGSTFGGIGFWPTFHVKFSQFAVPSAH